MKNTFAIKYVCQKCGYYDIHVLSDTDLCTPRQVLENIIAGLPVKTVELEEIKRRRFWLGWRKVTTVFVEHLPQALTHLCPVPVNKEYWEQNTHLPRHTALFVGVMQPVAALQVFATSPEAQARRLFEEQEPKRKGKK